MAKYINAEDLCETILNKFGSPTFKVMLNMIREIDAADVEPIKRGKWNVGFDGDGIVYECTNCLEGFFGIDGENITSIADFNYCPNCGAKMEGANDD